MPTARYTFSCHTERDWELIQYLDSFDDPRQRSWFIKAALIEMIKRNEEEELAQFPYDRLEAIEELQKKIWHELVALKKSGLVIHDGDPLPVELDDKEEIMDNVRNLWSKK